MADVVRAIIIMSLTCGALTVLLLLVKPIIHDKLPKSAQYALWLVALAALLIPVSSLVTLPTTAPTISEVVTRYAITAEEEMDVLSRDFSPMTDGLPDYLENPEARQPGILTTPITIFIIFYPFIAAAVLLYYLISYWRYSLKLRRTRVLTNISAPVRVYRSATAVTPMLIGVFRPIIILPDREYGVKELESILAHELTHLRRKDIWVKWLSVLAGAVHWFNPLVYVARRELDRACELSCDEAVIRRLDEDGKKNYGNTLLSLVAESRIPRAVVSTTMIEGKKALKERLGAIMKHKKTTHTTILVSAVLIIAAVLTACALGAGNRIKTVTEIIQSEPHFMGIVTEIQENTILVAVNEGEDARSSSDLMSVSLNVENPDGAYIPYVGDEVTVYYDGKIAESYPAQINKVYAILIEKPAQPPQVEAEETGVTVAGEPTAEEVLTVWLTEYLTTLKYLPSDNPQAVQDFEITSIEAADTRNGNEAILGYVYFDLKPYDIATTPWLAGNGVEGTGDKSGWIVKKRQEVVLKRTSDNYWTCAGYGTGGYSLESYDAITMTLNDVRTISEKIGADLTLNHLRGFIGEDVGSGLYVMRYDVDCGDEGTWLLTVGAGSVDSPVAYARLSGGIDYSFAVDIRYYDVDAFLAGEVKPIREGETPPAGMVGAYDNAAITTLPDDTTLDEAIRSAQAYYDKTSFAGKVLSANYVLISDISQYEDYVIAEKVKGEVVAFTVKVEGSTSPPRTIVLTKMADGNWEVINEGY